MSVTHEKNSSQHFDNAAALRALQLAQQTLRIEDEAIHGLLARLDDVGEPAASAAAGAIGTALGGAMLGRFARGLLGGLLR